MDRRLPSLLMASAALAGCGSSAMPGGRPAPAAGGTTTTLTITIPHRSASAGRRDPAYVSASTQSITVDVQPFGGGTSIGGFPLTANLTASSSGCTSTLTATVCNLSLTLAPGAYQTTLTTYDQTGGTGNVLAAAQTLPLTVVEGKANSVPLVLGGVPTTIALVNPTGSLVKGPIVHVITGSSSGAITAEPRDADGNTIVGAGSPSIAASTDNGAQIAVTQPSATQPYVVGVQSLASSAIAHLTITATPVSGSGGSTITKTFTVQTPDFSLLYLATVQVHVFDMTGTEVTPSGSFPGLSGIGGVGMTYDTANGFLYVTQQGSPSQIFAFDRAGNAQPLAAAATISAYIEGIVWNPSNNRLYVGNGGGIFDTSGNLVSGSGLPGYYALTYDPTHNYIIAGATQYQADGTVAGTLPFSASGVCYNTVNGYLYVSSVYPTAVAAYTTGGTAQTLAGAGFAAINGSSEQIDSIACDPRNGNVFMATNYRNTYGFDLNGNPLGAPWHDIAGFGAASGSAGLALVPPI